MAPLTLIPQERPAPRSGHANATFESVSDEQLMALIRAGHVRAFDTFVRRHRPAVASMARFSCGPDLADDVVQATFVSLWQNRDKYSADRGSPRSWLLAIARHRGIDLLRSRAARQRHIVCLDPHGWIGLADDSPAAEPAYAQVERAESSAVVHDLLTSLPPAQRKVIELSFFEGLSQQQIADRLAVPLGTVKGRMRLALTKLRERWEHSTSAPAEYATAA
jgi:RNA polymerase sigma-70 factor (ECF subfamily)